jgi:glutathione S-transferase
VLRATVLAAGATEKAGALVYERHFHPAEHVAEGWLARCADQLARTLAFLDASADGGWMVGDRMTQADVTLACLVFYLGLRVPGGFDRAKYAALAAIADRCEALPAFQSARPSADEGMPPADGALR